jgi:hypothetical protein
MTESLNKMVLSPRFTFEVNTINQILLQSIEAHKSKEKHVIISRVDNHLFLRFSKHLQHYWSP